MKKELASLIVLITALICTLILASCGGQSAFEEIKNRRNDIDFQLLPDYKIVCDIKGETFTGKAPSYSVLQLESEPTEFMQSFDKKDGNGFSFEKNTELEEKIDSHANCCLKIPQEHYPNWESDYKWFNDDGLTDALTIIYFPNELRLVFYESGH